MAKPQTPLSDQLRMMAEELEARADELERASRLDDGPLVRAPAARRPGLKTLVRLMSSRWHAPAATAKRSPPPIRLVSGTR